MLNITNLEKLTKSKEKFVKLFTDKFEVDSSKVEKLISNTNETSYYLITSKFLEGDLSQIIYIGKKFSQKVKKKMILKLA